MGLQMTYTRAMGSKCPSYVGWAMLPTMAGALC